MASLGNPRTWVPYMNNKDCSQGFCSLYCPQWCYIVYPPPPPPTFEFPQDHNDSTPNFSPLVIAIIGILLSAFLLVSYYTFISKYCGRNTQSSSSSPAHNHDEIEDNHNPLLHEPWHVSTNGLDEALIKSITVCKYKKEDGLVGGVTDCSVCLSEFEEDESLRLLPKCSHAFHLPCIDQWLKSHSNCPLCRALIFTFNSSSSTIQVPPPPVIEQEAPSVEIQNNEREENVRREGEMIGGVEESAKPGLRAFSDLGFMQGRHRMIEIRDELEDDEVIRRSVSMDHSLQIGEMEECCNEAGPSKRCGGGGESSKCSNRRKVLPCVWSPMAMKRSFSSGRFSIGRSGRGRQGIIPL